MSKPEIPNRVITKLSDGFSLTERDVAALTQFLHIGGEHNELFDSGLPLMLAEEGFDAYASDFAACYQKLRSYRPYVHPQAPFISAAAVWERFAPEINTLLDQIKQGPEEFSKDQLKLIFDLFSAEAQFPSHYLRQILAFQQSQYSWVQPDRSLMQMELSLGGWRSSQDWFGASFFERLCGFILEAGKYAEQQGFAVARGKAKSELIQLSTQAGLNAAGEKEAFYTLIQMLGIDEVRALDLWQRFLEFKGYLSSATPSSSSLEVEEIAKVHCYQLPASLQLKSFRSLLKFERYLDMVSHRKAGDLKLPTELLSPTEVKQNFPELVSRRFDLEIKSTSITEIASHLSLKETWDWEKDEANFSLLANEFPVISSKPHATKEERFAALESVGVDVRMKMDDFARRCIVLSHPEWIDEAMNGKEARQETISFRYKGEAPFFQGAKNSGELIELFMKGKSVDKLSFDGEHYYRVNVQGLSDVDELISYADALADQTLDLLLDRFLEAAYPYLSRRKELKITSFAESKDQIGAALYKDQLEAIKRAAHLEKISLDEYAAHRFDSYLEQVKAQVISNQTPPSSPWSLTEVDAVYTHEDAKFALAERLQPGEFSPVQSDGFFKLIEKQQNPERMKEETAKLLTEAKLKLLSELSTELNDKSFR